jgi:ubiquinone/menaquinone biosynthesis C-methylase UbiE
MTSNILFSARHAYDLAAANYDSWPWQEYWRNHEYPVLVEWLCLGRGPVLDLGTGTGLYLRPLVEAGMWSVGLDISGAMLEQAAAQSQVLLPLVQGDARSLPFAKSTFAQVLAARVLSQIDDLDALLCEASRVIERGGALLLSDLDPNHPYMRTELPGDGGKIAVQTYKRPLREVVRKAERHGLSLERSAHLRSPAAYRRSTRPASLDPHSDRPLAYLARLIKQT